MRVSAVSPQTETKPAASRNCRGGAGGPGCVCSGGGDGGSRLGAEGQGPVIRPFREGGRGDKGPARASGRRTAGTPHRGRPCSGAEGGGGPVKGGPGVAHAAGTVLGSRGEGAGVEPAPVLGSGAPVAPAGGRAGKGKQTPMPSRGAGSAAAAVATSQPGPRLPLPLAVSPGLYGDRIRSLAPPPPSRWSPRPAPRSAQPQWGDVFARPGSRPQEQP